MSRFLFLGCTLAVTVVESILALTFATWHLRFHTPLYLEALQSCLAIGIAITIALACGHLFPKPSLAVFTWRVVKFWRLVAIVYVFHTKILSAAAWNNRKTAPLKARKPPSAVIVSVAVAFAPFEFFLTDVLTLFGHQFQVWPSKKVWKSCLRIVHVDEATCTQCVSNMQGLSKDESK